jgi:hypothetical protein
MEATDVSQKIKYYGKIGNMWVSECWIVLDKANFSAKRYDAKELSEIEIKWLSDIFPGIKFTKITVTVEENEQPFNELIF